MAACVLTLAGAPPSAFAAPTGPRPAREIRLSPDGATASVRLDVLTYNIEGVPMRPGRTQRLREIGAQLDALRKAGRAPDVVLFQEAFSQEARDAVGAAGYPDLVTGPGRRARRDLPALGARKGHKWRKGEWGVRLVSSGLAIASVHPIVDRAAEPFSRRACAGLDCLSNKGALYASLEIPGVPDRVDVFNTHMNAQGASRVGPRRHTPVHHAQVRELSDFLEARSDPRRPVILGGDFNMRGSEARFEAFRDSQPLQLVHQYCRRDDTPCEVGMSWDGDAPWIDTQDLQLFRSGARVSIRPLSVESMFDGRPDSPSLSDHDGLRVVYELSWRVETSAAGEGSPQESRTP